MASLRNRPSLAVRRAVSRTTAKPTRRPALDVASLAGLPAGFADFHEINGSDCACGGRATKEKTSVRAASAKGGSIRARGITMKLLRRRFLHLVVCAAALPAASGTARALDYPTRSVRIVVGFPAGGPTDIFARLIGQLLSQRLEQPFVVENRPGAGSTIGIASVVGAPADTPRITRTSVSRPFATSLQSAAFRWSRWSW
jgi:hypothetical protein